MDDFFTKFVLLCFLIVLPGKGEWEKRGSMEEADKMKFKHVSGNTVNSSNGVQTSARY